MGVPLPRLAGRRHGIDGVPCAGVVVRSPRETSVPAFGTLAEALDATGARFVVSSVSWDSAPGVIVDAVTRGVPILTETPPAPDAEGLRRLWGEVGASGLVQAAEQYPRYPSHAARLALVRSGVLGTPTQTQVSSTQLYHAVALMRAYLGAPCGPATVRATTVTAPLLQPLARMGWTGATEPGPATTTHAVIDFGAGRSGVYDFTDLQTRNLLRVRRLVVRGTHGELDGDTLVRWGGPETILTSRLERRQSGHDLDMSGFDSETISHADTVSWRNPWPGQHCPTTSTPPRRCCTTWPPGSTDAAPNRTRSATASRTPPSRSRSNSPQLRTAPSSSPTSPGGRPQMRGPASNRP